MRHLALVLGLFWGVAALSGAADGPSLRRNSAVRKKERSAPASPSARGSDRKAVGPTAVSSPAEPSAEAVPPPAPPTTTTAGPSVGSAVNENVGSMEVTGQAKDKINIEKVTPEIKIDVKDLVDSVTDTTEKLLEQARPIPSDEDFKRFDRLESQQTARPWLADLVEPPIISFQPGPAQATVKVWRLEVTDDKGDVVHVITGKGNPVDEIVWDGFNKAGKMIRVASVYSFRFITVDEFKDTHTTLGKAFTLRHLKYKDKKNLIVEIASTYLFQEDKLNPEALPVLDRAVDVARAYSSFPLTVEFQTRDHAGEIVKSRQKKITEKIAADLLVPVDSVRYTYAPIGDRGDVLRFVIRLR